MGNKWLSERHVKLNYMILAPSVQLKSSPLAISSGDGACEITLRGKVLPIGGVREKLLAAYRAGIKTILLPRENESDLEKIDENIREKLEIHLVEDVNEVFRVILAEEDKEG